MATQSQPQDQLNSLVFSTRDQFKLALSDNSINFEAEAKFAVQALSASDFAMKTALNNKQSVIDAVTNVSAIGISLNPSKKMAYLVPRDGRICLDISYMGLIDIACSSGSIKWAHSAVVYKNDEFVLHGLGEQPTHNFDPFGSRGNIVGVFCSVKTIDGDFLTHTMPISEVYAIRDRSSQSFKSGKASPWKTDESEMIKKTCVKQAYKYWPKVERLQEAIHYLNTVSGEGLASLAPTRNPNASNQESTVVVDNVDEIIQMLEGVALRGVEAYRVAWNGLTDLEQQSVGKQEFKRIKEIAVTAVPPTIKEEEEANA
jgi:recombination protein RecT